MQVKIRGDKGRMLRHALLSSIFFYLLLTPSISFSQSKKQLEKDKAKIEQEIKRLNNDLANAKKNSRSSQKQLDLLGRRIDERTKLINNLDGQINLLNIQMAETEDSIRQLQTDIENLKQKYARAVHTLYRQRGNIDRATLLLDTKAYNESCLRMKFLRDYSRYCRRLAGAINSKKKVLRDYGDVLQIQQREQTSKMDSVRQQRDVFSRERQQQQQQLKNNKQQEKKLQQQIAQKEKQKRQLQQQIQRIIDAEVEKARKQKAAAAANTSTKSNSKANDADIALSKDFASNKGRLPWPVSYIKVEREFGRYTHASGGQNMNNGIDLVCQPGTSVKCVFNGVVSKVFIGPDGTKGLIVRHGNYMSVYLHLGTVAVGEGTNVKTGQNLGTVYTDASGNAEFSFQLWNEKTVQNPRQWLR